MPWPGPELLQAPRRQTTGTRLQEGRQHLDSRGELGHRDANLRRGRGGGRKQLQNEPRIGTTLKPLLAALLWQAGRQAGRQRRQHSQQLTTPNMCLTPRRARACSMQAVGARAQEAQPAPRARQYKCMGG